MDASPPAGTNNPSGSPSSEQTEPGDGQLKFGKSFTWDDGITITVSKPKVFTPSQYSKIKGAKTHVRFDVTVVNKSDNTLDLTLAYITLQSNNQEAEQVFDSAKGLKGSPSTKLLKGREAKWAVGFGVVNANDLVMDVALQDDFSRQGIVYTT